MHQGSRAAPAPLVRGLLLALATVLLGGTLAGCIVVAGGAVLGGAIVATDRRSVGIQLEDAQIEHRINNALDARFSRESVRIDVTAYNQKVLLAGQVPTDKDRADAEALAVASPNVRLVTNELRLGSLAGLNHHFDDELLAGKVRAALLDVPGLATGVIKVSCTNGDIYLMGRVSSTEADLAKRASSHINDVKRVVALFDLLSDAEVQDLSRRDPPPGTNSTAPVPGGH